jgi:hypothetical protein
MCARRSAPDTLADAYVRCCHLSLDCGLQFGASKWTRRAIHPAGPAKLTLAPTSSTYPRLRESSRDTTVPHCTRVTHAGIMGHGGAERRRCRVLASGRPRDDREWIGQKKSVDFPHGEILHCAVSAVAHLECRADVEMSHIRRTCTRCMQRLL